MSFRSTRVALIKCGRDRPRRGLYSTAQRSTARCTQRSTVGTSGFDVLDGVATVMPFRSPVVLRCACRYLHGMSAEKAFGHGATQGSRKRLSQFRPIPLALMTATVFRSHVWANVVGYFESELCRPD